MVGDGDGDGDGGREGRLRETRGPQFVACTRYCAWVLPYPTASVGSPRRFARQGVASPPLIGLHGACPSLDPTWPCTGTSVAQMPKDLQGVPQATLGKAGVVR